MGLRGGGTRLGFVRLFLHHRPMMLRRNLALAMIATLMLPGCERAAPPTTFRVEVSGTASGCAIAVEGRQVSHAEFVRLARAAVQETRKASVSDNVENTPFRCFGGALFELQEIGFTDVGFPSEPPPRSGN